MAQVGGPLADGQLPTIPINSPDIKPYQPWHGWECMFGLRLAGRRRRWWPARGFTFPLVFRQPHRGALSCAWNQSREDDSTQKVLEITGDVWHFLRFFPRYGYYGLVPFPFSRHSQSGPTGGPAIKNTKNAFILTTDWIWQQCNA